MTNKKERELGEKIEVFIEKLVSQYGTTKTYGAVGSWFYLKTMELASTEKELKEDLNKMAKAILPVYRAKEDLEDLLEEELGNEDDNVPPHADDYDEDWDG